METNLFTFASLLLFKFHVDTFPCLLIHHSFVYHTLLFLVLVLTYMHNILNLIFTYLILITNLKRNI